MQNERSWDDKITNKFPKAVEKEILNKNTQSTFMQFSAPQLTTNLEFTFALLHLLCCLPHQKQPTTSDSTKTRDRYVFIYRRAVFLYYPRISYKYHGKCFFYLTCEYLGNIAHLVCKYCHNQYSLVMHCPAQLLARSLFSLDTLDWRYSPLSAILFLLFNVGSSLKISFTNRCLSLFTATE